MRRNRKGVMGTLDLVFGISKPVTDAERRIRARTWAVLGVVAAASTSLFWIGQPSTPRPSASPPPQAPPTTGSDIEVPPTTGSDIEVPSPSTSRESATPPVVEIETRRWVSTFEVPHPGWVRLEIPPAILDASNQVLGDLKVQAPDGTASRFWIESDPPDQGSDNVDVTVSRKANGDLVIEIPNQTVSPVGGIEIRTLTGEFDCRAKLEARRDGGGWETIVENGVLYQRTPTDFNSKLSFAAREAGVMRLTLSGEGFKPEILKSVLVHPGRTGPPDRETPARILSKRFSSHDTEVRLDSGFRNLRVTGVRFEGMDGSFRTSCTLSTSQGEDAAQLPRLLIARGPVLRVPGPEPALIDRVTGNNRLHLAGRETMASFYGSERADLRFTGASLFYRPTRIVFRAEQAGSWRLRTGDPAAIPDPSVLHRNPPTGALDDVIDLVPGPLVPNPEAPAAEKPRDPMDQHRQLYREGWTHARRLEVSDGDRLIRFQLDAHALAGARDDLSDLRLLQNGKEVPLQLDRIPFPESFEELRSGRTSFRFSIYRGIQLDMTPIPPDQDHPDRKQWRVIPPARGVPAVAISPTQWSVPGSRIHRRGTAPGEAEWHLLLPSSDDDEAPERIAMQESSRGSMFRHEATFFLSGRRLSGGVNLERTGGEPDEPAPETWSISIPEVRVTALLTGTSPAFLYYGGPTAQSAGTGGILTALKLSQPVPCALWEETELPILFKGEEP